MSALRRDSDHGSSYLRVGTLTTIEPQRVTIQHETACNWTEVEIPAGSFIVYAHPYPSGRIDGHYWQPFIRCLDGSAPVATIVDGYSQSRLFWATSASKPPIGQTTTCCQLNVAMHQAIVYDTGFRATRFGIEGPPLFHGSMIDGSESGHGEVVWQGSFLDLAIENAMDCEELDRVRAQYDYGWGGAMPGNTLVIGPGGASGRFLFTPDPDQWA